MSVLIADPTNTPRPDDIEPVLDVRSVPPVPADIAALWEPGWGLSARVWAQADTAVDAGLAPDPDQRLAFGRDVATPVREGLTAVVNGLSRDRYRYAVGYVDGGRGFATDLKARLVMIDGSVLLDTTVPHDVRLGILLGATLHESGHVRFDRLETAGLEAAFPIRFDTDAVGRQAPVVSNLIGDIRLERRLKGTYPAYAGLYALTGWWVAKQHPTGRIGQHWRTPEEAVNFAIAATRYDGYTRYANQPDVLAERAWWIEWADRHGDTPSLIPAVEDALVHIREVLDTLPDLPVIDPPPPPPPPRRRPGGEEPPPPAGPCTCGCTTLAFAAPVKHGCTDPNCQCHGGGGGGEEPRPGPEPPPPGPQPTDEPPVYRRGDDTGKGDPDQPGKTFGISDPSDEDRPDDMAGQEVNALNSALPLHPDRLDPNDARNTLRVGRADHEARVQAQAAKDEVIVTRDDGRELKVAIVPGPRDGEGSGLVTDADATRALAAAFKRKRTLRERTTIARSGGKILPGKVYRLSQGSTAVFSRKDDPSPDRLDVHILVDASGSMTGRIGAAARVAANLTEALLSTRTSRVHVWAHNDGVGPGHMTLWDIYDSRRNQPVAHIGRIRAGGSNLDGTAIAAVSAVAQRERDHRERTMILVCSDGAPCEEESWVHSVVRDSEGKGIPVISVAIDGGLTAVQEEMYGHDSIVEWKGDWDQLGTDMADALGRKA